MTTTLAHHLPRLPFIAQNTGPFVDLEKAFNSAIRMLSRREHSETEVQTKLKQKFKTLTSADIEEIVSRLKNAGLLSNERFAEILIRSRVARGYGPFYIHQELAMKGIPNDLSVQLFEQADVDWQWVANNLVERRHADASENPQAWAKAARFLQRRGFNADIVAKALGAQPQESL